MSAIRDLAWSALLFASALIVGLIDECDRLQRRGEYAA